MQLHCSVHIAAGSVSSSVAAAGGDAVRGSCWLRTEPSGRCSGLYAVNVTRAECCALRPGSRYISYATGWTPTLDMTSRQYFYWIIVGQGVPGCQPCRSKLKLYFLYSCISYRWNHCCSSCAHRNKYLIPNEYNFALL